LEQRTNLAGLRRSPRQFERPNELPTGRLAARMVNPETTAANPPDLTPKRDGLGMTLMRREKTRQRLQSRSGIRVGARRLDLQPYDLLKIRFGSGDVSISVLQHGQR
jgi:hypothetical protein